MRKTANVSNIALLSGKPILLPPKKKRGLHLTVLGCGTSTGIPIIGCKCKTCRSKDARNHRTRASVYFEVDGRCLLVDTSPDFRFQGLQQNIRWIDAVLYTHPHADHLHGIDELRTYNYAMKRAIPCYGNKWMIDTIRTRFDYIFKYTQEGGGKPAIDLHTIEKAKTIAGIRVQPLHVIHGKLPVLGYRIKDVAYITDCSYIPEQTFKYLKNLQVLVLDCLRYPVHPTHLTVEQSLALAKRIGAKRTYFTHMGHDIEYGEFARKLPRTMYPAYDGLVISTY